MSGRTLDLSELVVVGTFVDAFDADAAARALESAGIVIVERRKNVEVVVRTEDADRALDVLRWVSSFSAGDFVDE
jgi:hypothetical protein